MKMPVRARVENDDLPKMPLQSRRGFDAAYAEFIRVLYQKHVDFKKFLV
jgi:hypothetical protein